MGTKGRLRRCFPGPAMTICRDRIADASFLEPLAELLTKLDAETHKEEDLYRSDRMVLGLDFGPE